MTSYVLKKHIDTEMLIVVYKQTSFRLLQWHDAVPLNYVVSYLCLSDLICYTKAYQMLQEQHQMEQFVNVQLKRIHFLSLERNCSNSLDRMAKKQVLEDPEDVCQDVFFIVKLSITSLQLTTPNRN